MTIQDKEHGTLAAFLRETFTNPLCPRYVLWHQLVNIFIFVSCLSLALETVDKYSDDYPIVFDIIEYGSVAFFALDYAQSIYYAPRRIGYLFSFWGIVDFLSIAPSFFMMLNLTALQGTKVFRLLRIIRVLRVLKLAREAMRQITSIDGNGKPTNPIIVNLRIYFIALFSVLMISSTLMFYAEGHLYTAEAMEHGQLLLDQEAQHAGANVTAEKFVPVDPISGVAIAEDKRFFTSIPTAMWWCITTLTTTGYGDLYPVTVLGRIIAGCTMLLGLVLFGILMNIVGKTLMAVLFGETSHHDDEKKHESKLLSEHGRKIAALLILAEEGILTTTKAAELASKDNGELKSAFERI
jgi:voltage-gated potassium channel Kch